MRLLVLSLRHSSLVTTGQSVSFSHSFPACLVSRLCLRWCCCHCGGDCADLCRRGCCAHKPSLAGRRFRVWLRHGFLHIRRCHFSMAFTSTGCFGPPSLLLSRFHFSGLLAHEGRRLTRCCSQQALPVEFADEMIKSESQDCGGTGFPVPVVQLRDVMVQGKRKTPP